MTEYENRILIVFLSSRRVKYEQIEGWTHVIPVLMDCEYTNQRLIIRNRSKGLLSLLKLGTNRLVTYLDIPRYIILNYQDNKS